jgi:NADPH-dependent 2,4-dienoyl-CoA reductase/sulfur reductase-like enzyme
MTRYIIIGGDAAGMSAAMQIRRTDDRAEIWAFEMGETFSYAQCGLPYYIEGIIPSSKDLIVRTEESFKQQRYTIK